MREYKVDKYDRAKRRVKEIKGFHRHLMVFVLVNIALFIINAEVFNWITEDPENLNIKNRLTWNVFFTPIFWGIGLCIHAINVFIFKGRFLNRWEERKIKEYMEDDTQP